MSSTDSAILALSKAMSLLIRANHILHAHGLVDAFGHISIRDPNDSTRYIIAAYDPGAPALVKSHDDFILYHVEDSSPYDASAPQGYAERYIHGEVFRRLPEAMCVVHSHSEAVIPFTLAGQHVTPVFHMAGFMGAAPLPVYIAPAGSDMLIKNSELGTALASHLSPEVPVVLQHKHGFTTFGGSVEEAVYRAVYTQTNCRLLGKALELAGERGGVEFLTKEECNACSEMNKKTQDKAFRLWLREVQVNPLYVNEEAEPEKGGVGGLGV